MYYPELEIAVTAKKLRFWANPLGTGNLNEQETQKLVKSEFFELGEKNIWLFVLNESARIVSTYDDNVAMQFRQSVVLLAGFSEALAKVYADARKRRNLIQIYPNHWVDGVCYSRPDPP